MSRHIDFSAVQLGDVLYFTTANIVLACVKEEAQTR